MLSWRFAENVKRMSSGFERRWTDEPCSRGTSSVVPPRRAQRLRVGARAATVKSGWDCCLFRPQFPLSLVGITGCEVNWSTTTVGVFFNLSLFILGRFWPLPSLKGQNENSIDCEYWRSWSNNGNVTYSTCNYLQLPTTKCPRIMTT